MFGKAAPVAFVNGRILTPHGEARRLRFDTRILSVDEAPQRGDHIVDLDGRLVLPGLINAHDHLELNHYGPLKGRERYANARQWIDDLRPRIREDASIRATARLSLADRLFAGGLKNLLAGVTTVAHHNPIYRAFGRRFPVRLVERFGWAHSLGLEGGPAGAQGEPGGIVAQRCSETPRDAPFVVHAGEGTDAASAAEIDTLEARGCLNANTVLVHGVAVTPARWASLFERGVSLVWCPASNRFLFGRTLCMPCVLDAPGAAARVCLGTDSRLTGAADLLGELRIGAQAGVTATQLLRMVTTAAADVLRLQDAGRIRVGLAADLTVWPASVMSPADALLANSRADLELVTIAGQPMVGAPAFLSLVSARGRVGRIEVDGQLRLAPASLARRIARSTVSEPGLAVA